MGLDMYLYKANKEAVTDPNGLFDLENFNMLLEAWLIEAIPSASELISEVAYWRKANAIHHFFVTEVQDNVDDCKPYSVDEQSLVNLLSFIDEVLSDTEKAEDLLPTQEGFFFGSTEYDEYYIDDLSRTKSMLSSLLDTVDWNKEVIIYQSSW